MPLRDYDIDESIPASGSSRRDPDTGHAPATSARRVTRPLVMIAVALILAILLVTLTWTLARRTPTADPDAASGDPSPAGEPAPIGGVAVPGESYQPTDSGYDAAPGLRVGTATVLTGDTTMSYGVRLGWSRTPEGAVGAAMTGAANWWGLPMLLEDTRDTLIERMFTPDGQETAAMSEELAGATREKYRLNDDGEVIEPNGLPSQVRTMMSVGMAPYGAYKIEDHNADWTEARIRVWVPIVIGPVANDADFSETMTIWQNVVMTMRWWDGDWRVAGREVDTESPARPADPRYTNQTYQARADLLGPGWMIPADATDQPYPGAVVTK